MVQREALEQGIAALDAQRATLGDTVVDALLAAARARLAEPAATAPSVDQRKQVTVLFADVCGSTALSESLDPEEVRAVMDSLWQHLDRAITDQGGYIDKHIGDAVMAVWGVDTAREDDPARAVCAALAMQAAVAQFHYQVSPATRHAPLAATAVTLAMRIGIHTGPVLLGRVGTTAEFTATGDTVNVASRLEHAAPVGGILISAATYGQVRGVFDVQTLPPITVKGKTKPLAVYVVQRARPRAFHMAQRGLEGVETHLIGREAEMTRLRETCVASLAQCETRCILLVGDAGVGKSRLLDEFDHWLDAQSPPVVRFQGRADAATQDAPYALLRDVLFNLCHIQPHDTTASVWQKFEQGIAAALDGPHTVEMAHFIGCLVGLDGSASPYVSGILADAAQIQRRALAYLTQFWQRVTTTPSVLWLEDIHWADDASLDWLDHLLASAPTMPLFILALARPTLLERRPQWGKDHLARTLLRLAPLKRRASRRLVANILRKADSLPVALRDLIVDSAGGNPYYIEELIKVLIEDGVIQTGDRWSVAAERLPELRIPPTLTAVLQARLAGLPDAERETLKRASVVGQVFWDEAVATLLATDSPARPDADSALEALRQREMVFRHRLAAFAQAHEYVFKHMLLRDVTYESVLLWQRRRFHRCVAEWLTARSGDRGDEYAGLIAEHYARAGEADQAATWFARAGQQAQGVYANPAAIEYYQRALQWLPFQPTAPHLVAVRFTTLLRLGQVNELIGQWAAADTHYHAARQWAMAMGDPAYQAQAHQALGGLAVKQGDNPGALVWLEQARVIFEASGDQARLAHTLVQMGILYARQGDHGHALPYLEAGLGYARQVGEQRCLAQGLNALGNMAVNQGEYAQAQAHFEDSLALRRALGDKPGVADTLGNLGVVAARRGDLATAQRLYEAEVALCRELGEQPVIAGALNNLGLVVERQGDYGRAQALFEESLTLFQAVGSRAGVALAHHSLGGAALLQGDYASATAHYATSLALRRELADQHGQASALNNLGGVAYLSGDVLDAANHYRAGLAMAHASGQRRSVAVALTGLGGVASAHGEARLGTQLAGAAQAILNAIGTYLDPEERLVAERGQAAARRVLGEDDYAAAWAAGLSLTPAEAVPQAFRVSAPMPAEGV